MPLRRLIPTRRDLLEGAGIPQAAFAVSAVSADIEIQVTSWHACDESPPPSNDENEDDDEDEDDEADADESKNVYTIYGFGVDPEGRSVCARIDGYTPFFFVKVTPGNNSSTFASLVKDMRPFDQHVKAATVMMKKDYWGFTDDAQIPFVRLTFKSLRSMRITAAMLRKPETVAKIQARGGGGIELYESNIDPLLRFLHIRKLSPAGWMLLPKGSWRAVDTHAHALQVSTCDATVSCRWTDTGPTTSGRTDMAPMVVASFDLECNSAHGDFPMAAKDYSKLAYDLTHKVWASLSPAQRSKRYQTSQLIGRAIRHAFDLPDAADCGDPPTASYDCVKLQLKRPAVERSEKDVEALRRSILDITDEVYCALNEENDVMLIECLNNAFERRWPIRGDPIIQIGTTYGVYGGGRPPCSKRIVFTLGTCSPLEGTDVYEFDDELEMILAWQQLVRSSDPDVVLGYNIFGFDFAYLYERATQLLGDANNPRMETFQRFGRLNAIPSEYVVKNLSSSALGDNELKYIDMHGRVIIDLMKVVQRDHRLDSFKLDTVAEHFLKERKDDVSPNDIFRLQKGSSDDRARIAKYCVQDCELCNRLASKLEILANNMGMANVCLVPLTYIFMRGQGIKIFSLVAKVCRDEGFVVPVRSAEQLGFEEDAGYEGAIVLEPQTGMYLEDPVCVLDYNSLYPSSMISHNLSHNTIVLNGRRYGSIPGVKYVSVSYDVNGVTRECRYATTLSNGKPYVGILPMILQRLLAQRKATRKQLAASSDAFERAVLDGLQNAYKVTANSLYGQMGARTSQLYLKDLAACTTAVGRSMILTAKSFVESNFGARVVYGDSVTGYTPILIRTPTGQILVERVEAIADRFAASAWAPMAHGDGCSSSSSKEACEMPEGFSAWTSVGWTAVRRVIRHALAPGKSILRVQTHTGLVDVTDEHSLISSDHEIVNAKEVEVGRSLLHNPIPSMSLMSSVGGEEDEDGGSRCALAARIAGAFLGCGRCSGGAWEMISRHYYFLEGYRLLCQAGHPEFRWAVLPYTNKMFPNIFKLVPNGNGNGDSSGDAFVQRWRAEGYSGEAKVVPEWVMQAGDEAVRTAFMEGLFEACGDLNPLGYRCFRFASGEGYSQISVASVFLLARALGYNVSISEDVKDVKDVKDCKDVYTLTITRRCYYEGLCKVRRISKVEGYSGYVYDLTTENHEFAAGIGDMIVHNTDSIFVVFPHRDTDAHRLADTIKQGQETSEQIKPTLPVPHNLEYEKTFFPFILLSKKRYVGLLYGNDATAKPVQKSMGIALKRRDYAPIVKTIYGGVIDILLTRRDVPAAVEFLSRALGELADGRYDLADLVISKTLKSTYKQPQQIAHWVLAQRMQRRDPGSAPQVNDRIPYVFVEPPKPNALMGDRIEHVEYVKAHPHEVVVDTLLYIQKQIQQPCMQLLAIALEQLPGYVSRADLKSLPTGYDDAKKAQERLETLRERAVEKLIFEPVTSVMGIKQRARLERQSRSDFAKRWFGPK